MVEPPAVISTPRLPWKRGAVGVCVITAPTAPQGDSVTNVWRAFIGTPQLYSATQTCAYVSFFTVSFLPFDATFPASMKCHLCVYTSWISDTSGILYVLKVNFKKMLLVCWAKMALRVPREHY